MYLFVSGVVDLSYIKTNAGQSVTLTCVVTGDPAAPAANQVQIQYDDDSGGVQNGILTATEIRGSYLIVTFAATPPSGNSVICSVSGISPTPYAAITTVPYSEY